MAQRARLLPARQAAARLWLADALLAAGNGCHWPIGETSSESFRYCGASRDATHDCPSYCAKHRALAYLRPDETQEERTAAEKRKARSA